MAWAGMLDPSWLHWEAWWQRPPLLLHAQGGETGSPHGHHGMSLGSGTCSEHLQEGHGQQILGQGSGTASGSKGHLVMSTHLWNFKTCISTWVAVCYLSYLLCYFPAGEKVRAAFINDMSFCAIMRSHMSCFPWLLSSMKIEAKLKKQKPV